MTTAMLNDMLNTLPVTRSIKKRDGVTIQDFDVKKIERAIDGAWQEVMCAPAAMGHLSLIARDVMHILPTGIVGVEKVQDAVEVALMRRGYFQIAKAYILYRQKRTEARLLKDKKPDPRALANYIHASKYARYRDDLQRRETYEETVTRVEAMHVRRFPTLADEIHEAFDAVRRQEVLPSMRSMQFAGKAIEVNNCKLYNCCFTLIDRFTAFSDAMFLLLCGCGVGYSVQIEHVECLSPLRYIDTQKIRHHVVQDTIEGWADALKALLQGYQDGEYVEFAYHEIRPAGAPLRTSGGRAPGHTKLKASLEEIRKVLDAAQGRQLRPIECHWILCFAADTALSGGIRRSAMIALFSLDDSEMMYAKTGNWYSRHPWLANANNSVALQRNEVHRKQFRRIFEMTRQWGEPGFFFTSDMNYGINPCAEIGLNPVLIVDNFAKARAAKKGVSVSLGEKHTGFAFCNLCEINASKFTNLEDFMKVTKAATLIGTLQATYTSFPYLGWVSEVIAEREALLGISMTGILDAPDVACNPEYQKTVARKINEWNEDFATRLGIQPAARTTCVKPSGTASLALGGVASGHHAHHARRYIRRVIADELEIVFQEYRKQNPHACIRKPDGKWVLEFPVMAPEGAIVKKDITAVAFLEMVRSTQRNWVLPGTARHYYSPHLTHNVSNTIHVQEYEWEEVANYLWNHSESLTGVSLLPAAADKAYPFAPLEEVVTEADEARWNVLVGNYKPIDYMAIREVQDNTTPTGELACAGGSCEVLPSAGEITGRVNAV